MIWHKVVHNILLPSVILLRLQLDDSIKPDIDIGFGFFFSWPIGSVNVFHFIKAYFYVYGCLTAHMYV